MDKERRKKTMLDEMKALVREKDICVLATVSNNRPHCSLMAYVANDACTEIYMVTLKDSKKYRNLSENPWVSLLIDTREEDRGPRRPQAKALTVTGLFEQIRDDDMRRQIREALIRRHSQLEGFADHPDAEVFSIRIHSFLLLDGLTNSHFETVG
jgi:nitroimidazol reductase NimA-like FMN-containing flavoprotein (pyridoxamine 5'-phosphate oxidase superfamily)